MNDFGMDADSNSWGSDYDQGDDYGSDYSDGEYQPGGAVGVSSSVHQQLHHPGPVTNRATKSTKNSALARKMVNRGRWTKEEVSPGLPSIFKDAFLFRAFCLLFFLGREIERGRRAHWRNMGNSGLLLRGPL
jgi:hypothetical protein